jgi:acylphosphatase|tara:strand:+ start:9134 stop:9409 length:276 start_codon:yes stop_codon:yes gene_type:complete
MKKGVNIRVYGRVQGVFFRKKTKAQADNLQITGWVKNNEDGSVSLHASGDEAQLLLLVKWLDKGPILAKVSSKDITWVDHESHKDFSIRYD